MTENYLPLVHNPVSPENKNNTVCTRRDSCNMCTGVSVASVSVRMKEAAPRPGLERHGRRATGLSGRRLAVSVSSSRKGLKSSLLC